MSESKLIFTLIKATVIITVSNIVSWIFLYQYDGQSEFYEDFSPKKYFNCTYQRGKSISTALDVDLSKVYKAFTLNNRVWLKFYTDLHRKDHAKYMLFIHSYV